MSKQQKYRQQTSSIIQEQPQIKLFQLIYQVYNKKIPINDIITKLQQIQQNINHQLQNYYQNQNNNKLDSIPVKELQEQKLFEILQYFQPIYNEILQQEEFVSKQQNVKFKQTESKDIEQQENINLKSNKPQKDQSANSQNPHEHNIFTNPQEDNQFQFKQPNHNNQAQQYEKQEFQQNQSSQFDQNNKNKNKINQNKNITPQGNKQKNTLNPKTKNNSSAKSKQKSQISTQDKHKSSRSNLNSKQKKSTSKSNKLTPKVQIKKQAPKYDQQHSFLHPEKYSQQQQLSSTQTLPNFQNKKQLEEFLNDQKEHKNLFDDKPFQFVQSPKNIQRSHSFYSKQFQNLRSKLKRYLIGAYHEYTLQAYNALDILQQKSMGVNSQKKHLMDLRIYLKFYKDFDVKQLLKVNEISKIFKKQAINHLWADLQKFIQINFRVIERKTPQNVQEGTIDILNQQQLIQRAKKFLSLFTKQRIKKYLKITNKQNLQKIIDQYTLKQSDNHQIQGNKVQIVDKFLKRNFNQQVLNWYNKKEIDFNKVGELKKKASPSKKKNKDKRKEQSIHNDIQKLRSQSQKNINQLKSLLNFDITQNNNNQENINEQSSHIQYQKSNKIQKIQKSMKSLLQNPESNRGPKKPLHKNKHKNIPSAYKQLQGYNEDHFKSLKSNKNLLREELNISEDEPYLKAYFNKQLALVNESPNKRKDIKSKNEIQLINSKNLKNLQNNNDKNINRSLELARQIKGKQNDSITDKKQLPNLMKNLNKNIKSSKNIQSLPKISNKKPDLVKKSSSQVKLNHVKNYLKSKNQFINENMNIFQDQVRSKNNRSQPSNPKKPQYLKQSNRKRINSMKKLVDRNKSKNSILNVQQQLFSLPVNPINQSKKKMNIINSKDQDIINLKLYQFLQSKEQKMQLINDSKRKKNNKNQLNNSKNKNDLKDKKNIKSVDNLKIKKQNIQSSLLMNQKSKIKPINNSNKQQIVMNKKLPASNNNAIKNSIDQVPINSIPSTQSNSLMKNYQDQVYELFKYFKKRDQQEDTIVQVENQKRKGYLLGQQRQKSIKKMSKKNLAAN